MKTNKTKLLFAGLITSAMVVAGAGCSTSNTSQSYDDGDDDDFDSTSTATPPAPPQIEGCTEWEYDGDQWVCEDGSLVNDNGGGYVYFYNGMVHKSSITTTSGYKSKASSSVRSSSGSNSKVTTGAKSSVKSSGLGSGTKGGFSTGG